MSCHTIYGFMKLLQGSFIRPLSSFITVSGRSFIKLYTIRQWMYKKYIEAENELFQHEIIIRNGASGIPLCFT